MAKYRFKKFGDITFKDREELKDRVQIYIYIYKKEMKKQKKKKKLGLQHEKV